MRSQIIYRNKAEFFGFFNAISSFSFSFKRSIKYYEVLLFIKSIADFLSVNNDIIFALESSMHCISKKYRNIIESVIIKIKQGENISCAFASFGFLPVFAINILRVGEKNSSLSETFLTIFNLLQWNYDQKSKLKRALFYPCFTFCVFIFVLFLFSNYVVPSIIDFMDSLNFEGKDRVEFLYSFLFYCNFFIVAIFCFIIAMCIIYFVNYGFFQSILMHFPFIGNFIVVRNLYLFAFAVQSSLKNGVSIIETLNSTLEFSSGAFSEMFSFVKNDLIKGSKLYLAFDKFWFVPNDFKKIIKSGENSGKLLSAFQSITKIYEGKYKGFIESFINVLPVFFVILTSLLMLVFVVLIFIPIYNISSSGF